MTEEATARLERVMSRGFETLADLQRETNARLDQTNARLDQTNARLDQTNARLERVEGAVESLTQRVMVIEHVLQDFAAQLVTLARAVKHLAESQDAAIGDLRRRVEALEQHSGS